MGQKLGLVLSHLLLPTILGIPCAQGSSEDRGTFSRNAIKTWVEGGEIFRRFTERPLYLHLSRVQNLYICGYAVASEQSLTDRKTRIFRTANGNRL